MPETLYLLFFYAALPLISMTAFFLKGITGTGTSTVIIALSSFLIDPKLCVVLAAFMNIFGGFAMVKLDPVPLARPFWIPVALCMMIGSMIGAYILTQIPNEVFQMILGGAFLIASIWFLFKPHIPQADSRQPDKASAADKTIGGIAGLSGGFIGINAPILILHFSRRLDKRHLRRLLVLIFIPAAIMQTAIFAGTGLLNKDILIYGGVMIPAMVIGIHLGNKSFYKISEKRFRHILGAFLIIVSVRLIWTGLGHF